MIVIIICYNIIFAIKRKTGNKNIFFFSNIGGKTFVKYRLKYLEFFVFRNKFLNENTEFNFFELRVNIYIIKKFVNFIAENFIFTLTEEGFIRCLFFCFIDI